MHKMQASVRGTLVCLYGYEGLDPASGRTDKHYVGSFSAKDALVLARELITAAKEAEREEQQQRLAKRESLVSRVRDLTNSLRAVEAEIEAIDAIGDGDGK